MTDIIALPLAVIARSPFNPRKTFEGIDELAASIAEQGLLENLVVRQLSKAGTYELVAGERRFRALQQLQAETAPCRIIKADDGQAMAVQILENLQRENIPPLEEAEAFQRLQQQDPKKWTAAAIGKAIGKTDRFVQQRLAMARNLAPEARELVEQGRINVESARILAGAPQSLQQKLIEEGAGWLGEIEELNPDEIRHEINNLAIPLERAAFDVAHYTGDWIGEGKQRRFGDIAQFDRLQEAAALALLRELQARWPKAKRVDVRSLNGWVWADTGMHLTYGQRKDKAKAPWKVATEKVTAIVWIDSEKELRSAEGVMQVSNLPQRTPGSYRSYEEKPERKAVREAFNASLRKALVDDCDLALKTLLFANATNNNLMPDDEKAAHALALPKLKLTGAWPGEKKRLEIWTAIAKMKPAEVTTAIAVYAAYELETWASYQAGCPPELLAIGATAGVKPEAQAPAAPTPKPAAKKKPVAKTKKKGGRK